MCGQRRARTRLSVGRKNRLRGSPPARRGAHRREVIRANLKGELAELGYARLQNVKRGESAERAQTAIAKVTIAKQTMSEFASGHGSSVQRRRGMDPHAHQCPRGARTRASHGCVWAMARGGGRRSSGGGGPEKPPRRRRRTLRRRKPWRKSSRRTRQQVKRSVIARRSLLPDAALMKRLEELEHQLAVAEASSRRWLLASPTRNRQGACSRHDRRWRRCSRALHCRGG